jgi:hypothetical protein
MAFIKASLILQSVALTLNERNISPPTNGISLKGSWELYHVEMVLFMLGHSSGDR